MMLADYIINRFIHITNWGFSLLYCIIIYIYIYIHVNSTKSLAPNSHIPRLRMVQSHSPCPLDDEKTYRNTLSVANANANI